jgi:hypothetical protein
MADKHVALCIASRGNPRALFETLHINLRGCALPSTQVVVGLDEDDPALADIQTLIELLACERIVVSIAPRADTLGAVYNRCAAAVDADLYINSADDFRILSPRWDAALAQASSIFPDGIGMIGFGKMPVSSPLPACEATTRGLIDKMGYYLQDYTPYWWMDTWLCEIATMIGRIYYLGMKTEFVGSMQTRGLREISYWARFFDEMRGHRRAVAEAIIASPDFVVPAELRQELRNGLDEVCVLLERRNAILRDPDYAKQIEISGFDAQEDERYRRAKERSLKALQELGTDRPAKADHPSVSRGMATSK